MAHEGFHTGTIYVHIYRETSAVDSRYGQADLNFQLEALQIRDTTVEFGRSVSRSPATRHRSVAYGYASVHSSLRKPRSFHSSRVTIGQMRGGQRTIQLVVRLNSFPVETLPQPASTLARHAPTVAAQVARAARQDPGEDQDTSPYRFPPGPFFGVSSQLLPVFAFDSQPSFRYPAELLRDVLRSFGIQRSRAGDEFLDVFDRSTATPGEFCRRHVIALQMLIKHPARSWGVVWLERSGRHGDHPR